VFKNKYDPNHVFKSCFPEIYEDYMHTEIRGSNSFRYIGVLYVYICCPVKLNCIEMVGLIIQGAATDRLLGKYCLFISLNAHHIQYVSNKICGL
jgi:hypothetical protein